MFIINFLFVIIIFIKCAFVFDFVRCESRVVQERIPDLDTALEMASILLSGNLEEEIVKLKNRKTGSLPVTFENIYAELDRGEIILLKPTLRHLPAPILKEMEVKLERNHLMVSAEWLNVTVYASYESHYERGTAPAIRIDGQLSFRWNWIRAQGLVGLAASSDSLQVLNNDLSYTFGSLSLEIFDHNSELVEVSAVINACEHTAPKLYWDLNWELQSSLDKKLNETLKDAEVFRKPMDFHDYRRTSRNLTAEANKFVDGFLDVFRATIFQRELEWIPLKDIRKSVNTKLGIVSLHGDFSALNGSAGDLSTIKRVGDFSIWTRDNADQIELSGLVDFAIFSGKYYHYEALVGNVNVLGSIKALTVSNLAALKLRLIPEQKSIYGYNITVQEVQVLRLGHLSVEVTGMGTLNNFVSLIATMVLNHFKADLVEEINKNLEFIFKTIVNPHWTI